MKKNICVLLSNRTNYSKIKPVLKELNRTDKFNLKIVASSSLLLEKYGNPFNDIIKDGYSIDHKIDCLLMNDSHESMAKTTSISMILHANYFGNNKIDLVLVVGDRFDIFPGVMCASMMNIPIAHIQGGELSGTIDNKIRDLISKLSSLHFPSTEASKKDY